MCVHAVVVLFALPLIFYMFVSKWQTTWFILRYWKFQVEMLFLNFPLHWFLFGFCENSVSSMTLFPIWKNCHSFRNNIESMRKVSRNLLLLCFKTIFIPNGKNCWHWDIKGTIFPPNTNSRRFDHFKNRFSDISLIFAKFVSWLDVIQID